MSVYIDKNTVQQAGKDGWAVWTMTVLESVNPLDGELIVAAQQKFECRARRWTLLARIPYDSKGMVIDTGRWENSPPSPITPSTLADELRRYLCKDNPPMTTGVENSIKHGFALFGRPLPDTKPAEDGEQGPGISTGTGFFVDPDGLLVTAYHVIAGAKAIVVYAGDGAPHKATVVKASEATDLAVLRVDYRSKAYLPLAPANSARPGDHVFTFGFPVVEVLGYEPKFTDGAISSLTGLGDEAIFAQISVPVQPGNSGGPLVNDKGEVVGVIDAVAKAAEFVKEAGTLPQNVNWAVRSEYVVPLVTGPRRPPAASREQAVALARDAVALIVAQE